MITAALPPLLLAPMVLKPWLPPSCYSPPSVGSSVSTAAANGSSVAAVSCGAVRAGMCDKPQRGSHGTVFVSYTHPRTHTRKAEIGHQAAITTQAAHRGPWLARAGRAAASCRRRRSSPCWHSISLGTARPGRSGCETGEPGGSVRCYWKWLLHPAPGTVRTVFR